MLSPVGLRDTRCINCTMPGNAMHRMTESMARSVHDAESLLGQFGGDVAVKNVSE